MCVIKAHSFYSLDSCKLLEAVRCEKMHTHADNEGPYHSTCMYSRNIFDHTLYGPLTGNLRPYRHDPIVRLTGCSDTFFFSIFCTADLLS